jgi:hypothetical protein
MSDENNEYECPDCGGEMVVENHQKHCTDCWYVSGSQNERVGQTTDAWERFWNERQAYNGFHGSGRVKFVGGFEGAYSD